LTLPSAVTSSSKSRNRFRPITTIVAIFIVYLTSLAGYFWLERNPDAVNPGDLTDARETVVLLELMAIHPTENRIETGVMVLPDASLVDPNFGTLNTDISVRLYPSMDFGELNFPAGQTPQKVSTSMLATGDANRWPFDVYQTKTISADVIVGKGESRRYVPARVEVYGSLYGWDINSDRTGPATNSGGSNDNATITFWRSRGPLALIGGLCLVLITLPAVGLFVAIEMLLGRRKFQPPFGTWFAAMLFAVVPIRSVLPGNPPPGSWVDEAIVLWVLIALTSAMVIYVFAWWRRSD
jgi:hypothetical protein